MVFKENLERFLKEMNLDYYETASDISEETSIQLFDFEQLCLFIQKHNIDTVFYHYDYASADDLQITGNILADLHIDEEILAVMKQDFKKYNQAISHLDFARPYALTVYCIYQNQIIYIDEYDYWFRDMGYGIPEKAAITMIEDKLEEIDRKKEEAYEKRESLREQLRDQILSDKEFHKCTNRELRRSYTQKLCNNDTSIHDLFYSPRSGIFDIPIGTFIEEVWREYKANL